MIKDKDTFSEVFKEEIANLENEVYHLIHNFEARFVKRYKHEIEEEMKKFEQGFAYKSPKCDFSLEDKGPT